MFEYKTLEELSKMTVEEQQKYMEDREKHEASLRKAEIDKAIEDAKKDNVSKEEIQKLIDKQSEIIKEIERISLEQKKQSEVKTNVGSGLTLFDALNKAFEPFADEMKAIHAAGGKQDSAIKVAVVMQVDNTIGAGDTQVTITQNTGIISQIRKRELRYMAQVSVGRIGTSRALWIEETDEQGTPIMIGEGDAKTQLSVKYVEKTESVKKIAVYGKVTSELMADLPQLISYIQNNLMKRMDITLENQLFNGDGIGDNLKGANTYATAFNGGGLAGEVESPNDYDVIAAINLQAEVAFGMPTGVFVNPKIAKRMKLQKDAEDRYLLPPFTSANGLTVDNVVIIPTTAVTGENFLGGDLSVINVLIREEIGIQIGLDGNDFTQNKKTMLLEKRLVQFVSANDAPVLIKGAFDTAKALLATT